MIGIRSSVEANELNGRKREVVGGPGELDDTWMNDMLDLDRVPCSSSLLRSHPRPIPYMCK